MRKVLFGAVALAAVAVAPGLASAQYYTYYAPPPHYDAPVYYQPYAPYPTYTGGMPFYNVPPGYLAPSMAPAVDWGQASASSHGTTVWGTSTSYYPWY